MEQPCLNDKTIYPDDTVLTRCLGKAKPAWDAFVGLLSADYPFLAAEWRYYNDGKLWLFKVTHKTKTVCWTSVREGHFSVTFYFSGKAEEAIAQSSLDETMKAQWVLEGQNGKFRPITMEMKKKADLKTLKKLVELKLRLK